MPCRTDFEYSGTSTSYISKEEHDKVIRVACNLFKIMQIFASDHVGINPEDEEEIRTEVYNIPSNELDEIFVWYKEHKKQDEARKAKLKESALKKLTNEEKEALGL